jgi:hypothetical protein
MVFAAQLSSLSVAAAAAILTVQRSSTVVANAYIQPSLFSMNGKVLRD